MDDLPQLRSRRTLTLRFDIPISKTREFWESLRRGKFITTKCANCGRVSFPPQSDCPYCMASDSEWVDLGPEASLVTFTQVRVTPASFEGKGPYTIAIAEFRGGVRALAWLEGAGPETAEPGMKVRIEARTGEGGNPYYVFVPS